MRRKPKLAPKGGATCFGKHISGERPLKKGENRNRFD